MARNKRRKKNQNRTGKRIKKLLLIILILIIGIQGYKKDNLIRELQSYIKIPDYSKIKKIFLKEKGNYIVLYVSDGDTVSVKRTVNGKKTGEVIKIRLFGIDAPEISQDYGYESKVALMNMIKGKNIEVENREKDKYGRLLGIIYHEGKNINEEMVKQGYAWWYEEYDKDNERMRKYEENARNNRIGLFSRKGYVAPWEFRKRKLKK